MSSFPEWGRLFRSLLDIPNRLVSCVDLGMVGLHAIAGRQALLQQRRKLLRELLPVLFPDLVLEAMQDLGEKKQKAENRHGGQLTSQHKSLKYWKCFKIVGLRMNFMQRCRL